MRRVFRNCPVAWIAAVAIALRLLLVVFSSSFYDSVITDRYDIIAQNLISDHGFSYVAGQSVSTVTRAPFFPLSIAAVSLVFGSNFIALRGVAAIVDTANAVLIYLVVLQLTLLFPLQGTERRRYERLATLAGILYACNPVSAYFAVKIVPETWFIFWLLLSFLSFLRVLQRQKGIEGIGLGLAAGILLLNKSVALFLPLLWCLVAVGLKQIRRGHAFPLVIAAATAAMVVAPWTARNFKVTSGAIVPVQTLTWFNFWYDFDYPTYLEGERIRNLYPQWGGHPYGLEAEIDVRQEKYFADLARQWIAGNPSAFAAKAAANVGQFWYLCETELRSRVLLAWNGVCLAIAIVGLLRAWRARWQLLAVFCVVTIGYFNLLYAPIFAVGRYSLVVVPFICVLAACGVIRADSLVERAERSSTAR